MTDGIRDALGMDTKNRTIRNLADSRQRERTRAEQVEQERDRLREERDRYRGLLRLAAQFAEENLEVQAKQNGQVFDGRWLTDHIQDALEGKE